MWTCTQIIQEQHVFSSNIHSKNLAGREQSGPTERRRTEKGGAARPLRPWTLPPGRSAEARGARNERRTPDAYAAAPPAAAAMPCLGFEFSGGNAEVVCDSLRLPSALWAAHVQSGRPFFLFIFPFFFSLFVFVHH